MTRLTNRQEGPITGMEFAKVSFEHAGSMPEASVEHALSIPKGSPVARRPSENRLPENTWSWQCQHRLSDPCSMVSGCPVSEGGVVPVVFAVIFFFLSPLNAETITAKVLPAADGDTITVPTKDNSSNHSVPPAKNAHFDNWNALNSVFIVCFLLL